MTLFSKAEMEREFEAYQERGRVAGEAGDWSPWADQFTEDALYIEHLFGRFEGREAIRGWITSTDGVVSRSYFSSTYGNVVFVTHSIGGQQWTTVYAHLSSRQVGEGAVVAKGQQVGIMGNTGHSYGQHLHFELHKGPWNYSKSNAVNPLNYINI